MLIVASTAFAANVSVDVLAIPVTVHTPVFLAGRESLDVNGQAYRAPLDAYRSGLGSRGLALEVSGGMRDWGWSGWVVSARARVANPTFALEGADFAPVATELHLQGGFVGWIDEQPDQRVTAYGIGLFGFGAGVVTDGPYTDPLVAPVWSSAFGLGVGRRGVARWRLETRVELTPRIDRFEGRAELPTDALVWTYLPGSASASIYIGGGFGKIGVRRAG